MTPKELLKQIVDISKFDYNISGIYLIYNVISEKGYIGSSTNIRRRWINHKNKLKANKHNNLHLQNSYNIYGLEKFSFYAIELLNKEELLNREDFYLSNIDKELFYNLNYKVSLNLQDLETKEKLKNINLGRRHTDETKRKISRAKIGRKLSEEHKQKLKEKNKKNFLGRHHTNETKAKISKANKGRKGLKTRLGRKDTEKTKQLKRRRMLEKEGHGASHLNTLEMILPKLISRAQVLNKKVNSIKYCPLKMLTKNIEKYIKKYGEKVNNLLEKFTLEHKCDACINN